MPRRESAQLPPSMMQVADAIDHMWSDRPDDSSESRSIPDLNDLDDIEMYREERHSPMPE